MNSPQSKRTHIHGSSVAAAAALLIGLFTTGQAAAQSSGPVAVDPTRAKQDVTTKHGPVAHDPFSEFTYEALGATPSLQLPAFIRKLARASAVESPDVSSVDRTETDTAAKATAVVRPDRTGTAARVQ
jgi:hypothetical protein